MLSIPVFAIAYMLKGGWLGKIQGWDDRVKELGFAGKLLGGKLLSGFLVFLFCAVDSGDWLLASMLTVAWFLAVSPSMGEEAGAIGRWGHWWGKYRERGFDRMYGVLKGVQRGAWMGAVFTVAGATTLSIPIMALGFVAAHFIGQEIYYRLHGRDSWAYAELMVGALLGLCYAFSF